VVHVHDASLFLKPFSFPRRCAKLERERERVGSWRERENFVFVVLFCVECRGREERGKKDAKSFLVEMKKRTNFFQFFNFFFCFHFFSRAPREAKILFDFKSRQTNKKTRGGKKNEKKEEERQKASALHEVFMLCFVLFKTIE
jgi:hypothetical protein